MDTSEQPKEKKTKDPFDSDKMRAIIDALKEAMTGNPEDQDQEELVKMVQKSRVFILEYAMSAYLDNPRSASLLEGVNAIFTQIEKVVRDDRKERMKKKENENNVISFNQMMEALDKINQGAVRLPVFDFKDFILDPTKPVQGDKKFFNPITEEELVQGIQTLDFEGNKV